MHRGETFNFKKLKSCVCSQGLDLVSTTRTKVNSGVIFFFDYAGTAHHNCKGCYSLESKGTLKIPDDHFIRGVGPFVIAFFASVVSTRAPVCQRRRRTG